MLEAGRLTPCCWPRAPLAGRSPPSVVGCQAFLRVDACLSVLPWTLPMEVCLSHTCTECSPTICAHTSMACRAQLTQKPASPACLARVLLHVWRLSLRSVIRACIARLYNATMRKRPPSSRCRGTGEFAGDRRHPSSLRWRLAAGVAPVRRVDNESHGDSRSVGVDDRLSTKRARPTPPWQTRYVLS